MNIYEKYVGMLDKITLCLIINVFEVVTLLAMLILLKSHRFELLQT